MKKEQRTNRANLYDYSDGQKYIGKKTEEIFTQINRQNSWGEDESVSGIGSSQIQTATLVKQLPLLLKKNSISSLLDLPCGDFNWLQHVDFSSCKYVGGDIVGSVIDENKSKFQHTSLQFKQIDLMQDQLGNFDMILCRDCLVHLSFRDIKKSLINISSSNIKYLLTTTFTNQLSNYDIPTGGWRPINLQVVPFNFPSPLEIINENCSEMDGEFSDKSMALWSLDNIRDVINEL